MTLLLEMKGRGESLAAAARRNLGDELRWFASQAMPPRVRSMRQFAEEEIIIPTGDFAGLRYRCDRQPFTRLWFAEVDSGRWTEHWVTGPSQSSKTLSCGLIPLLYTLFELRETIIFGLPDINMAKDKWIRDLLPVIEKTRYVKHLPRKGAGSQGGIPDLLEFSNGAFLKFMGGGGGDKQRAHFNSKNVVITEVDGMDESGEASAETDKINQILARTRGYELSKIRIYAECTVTTEQGKIWTKVSEGSASQIALKCAHCGEWVIPKGTEEDRKLLVGWQEAPDEVTATENARFACWHCGAAWSEAERRTANENALLVHRGQTIENDQVVGPHPRTRSLGFRWSAIHNCLVSPARVAQDEWRHARETDETKKENQQRELNQFVWCIPYAGDQLDLSAISRDSIMGRTGGTRKGIIPAAATIITVGVDVRKRQLHYLAVATEKETATSTIIDYGVHPLDADHLGEERALIIGLHELHEYLSAGWQREGGGVQGPHCVLIDSAYNTEIIYGWIKQPAVNPQHPWTWWPSKGYGKGQDRLGIYRPQTKKGPRIKHIGEQYHVSLLPDRGVYLVEMNGDFWKTRVHNCLAANKDEPGALRLYEAMPREHAGLANHLTAEMEREGWDPTKGWVRWWEKVRKSNHWFDCAYAALAAANFCGATLVPVAGTQGRRDTGTKGEGRRRLTMPDGRPYLITERE